MTSADVLIDLGARPGWAILIISIGVVLALALVWFILRQVGGYFVNSARVGDLPSTLILVLALLALVLIVGALITGSDSAWTVAAAAVGAISASLTSYFQRTNTAIEADRAPLEEEPDEDHLLPQEDWDVVQADAEERSAP